MRTLRTVTSRQIVAGPTVSPLIVWLTCLGIACFLLISGIFLDVHGWPYSLEGSPIPLKIHPGSYFIFLAFLLLLFRGNPVLAMYRLAAALPRHFIHLATIVGLIVYILVRFGKSGASFMIDLYLVPVILAFLLSRFSDASIARIFVAAIVCLTLNGAIGIIEYMLHARLTPYLIEGKPVEELFFRPTALLGHPLQNATIMAVTLLVLPVLRDRKLLLAECGILVSISLVVFGGRSALAVLVGIAVLTLPYWGMRQLLRRNYSYQQLVGTMLFGLCLGGLATAVLTLFGSETRIFASLHWDDSANARLIGLRALELVSSSDIMFGIGQQGIIDRSQLLQSYYGIIGLENSWLLLLLLFGAFGLLLFATSLLLWIREMLIGGPTVAILAAIAYIVIASTNNTLAAKDCSLIILTILLYGARGYSRALEMREGKTRQAQNRRDGAVP